MTPSTVSFRSLGQVLSDTQEELSRGTFKLPGPEVWDPVQQSSRAEVGKRKFMFPDASIHRQGVL